METEFTIRTSKEISWTNMPGGSFGDDENLIYDIRNTAIENIERETEASIRIDLRNEWNSEKRGWIRSISDEGRAYLEVIYKLKDEFIGKSYDYLINYSFISG